MREFRDLGLLGALKFGSGVLLGRAQRALRKLEETVEGGGAGEPGVSEGRFRTVIDQSPLSIHIFAPDGRSLRANASWYELWSLDEREEPEGTSIFEDQQIRDLGLLPYIEESVACSCTVSTPPLLYEPARTGREGEPRWLQASVYPLRDEAGTVVEMALLIQDVTECKRSEQLLRQQSAAITASMDGVAILDEGGVYAYMNAAHAYIFGYDGPEELLGKSWKALYEEEEVRRLEREVEPVLLENGRWRGEAIGKRRDGSTFPQEVSLTLIEGGGTVCVVRDISERKRAEEALRESEERFRSAFEDAPIGAALVGLDERFLQVNRALCEMLGYSEEELLRKTLEEITHPDDLEKSAARTRWALEEGSQSHTMEKRYVHADGRVVWTLSSVSLVLDSRGNPDHFVSLFQDVTGRKALEERLEYQAFHDTLTGLANRALFTNRLEHALARLDRRKEPIAVLFVDLDNLKVVNDSLGHEVGDKLLAEAAGRLKESVRPQDTVARFGGDEFAVLLEGILGVGDAERVAKRIIESMMAPFGLEGREVFVSASIGIVPAINTQDEPEELLRNADLALYGAKNKGKARYEFFDESMSAEALERLEMDSSLRRALEREEFRVYYQPKLSVEDGKIVSLEALVRWEHPERGLLEPDEFLSVAEESGFIVQIGEWVLREVCRQGHEWEERFAGQAPRVCTNVSARQFLQTDLVSRVTETLQSSGLRARGLSLEVPEGVLMDDAEDNVEKLTALKDLGIHVVIDDFGTAYSSLSHLKEFPLNFLKVDRSLTVKLGEKSEDDAIVAAMINLAHALGWAVTAQGVETEEQLALLREMNCDIVQGYYLSRPVTAEEATALLEENLRAAAS